MEGGNQNKGDNGAAAAYAKNDYEIHNLDEEFEGLGDEEIMKDVGLDLNVLNDLLNSFFLLFFSS